MPHATPIVIPRRSSNQPRGGEASLRSDDALASAAQLAAKEKKVEKVAIGTSDKVPLIGVAEVLLIAVKTVPSCKTPVPAIFAEKDAPAEMVTPFATNSSALALLLL